MRTLLIVAAASVALTAPAFAQSPAPHSTAHPKPVMTFTNPSHNKSLPTTSGSDCIHNAASTRNVNPITGQPGSQTLVSVPITKGGGSVASATNHAQQREACRH